MMKKVLKSVGRFLRAIITEGNPSRWPPRRVTVPAAGVPHLNRAAYE